MSTVANWIVGIAFTLMLLSPFTQAQERGQYLPGFQGLNSGMQSPAGFTYANYFIWYPTSTFKNRNGNDLPSNFDINLIADYNIGAYTTKHKFLGATYGFAAVLPVVSTAVDLPVLGTGISPWGIGDMYFEPIDLGWTLKNSQTRIKAAYGFVAPTGRFDATGSDSTTTDFWGHQVTFAVTHPLGKTKLWQVSASTNWEFHQGKRHEDLKVGNNMTLEYGVGKTWVHNAGKQLIQLGAVGYGEFQLTDDSGAAALPSPLLSKDRVFALGPEFGLILPPKKLNFLLRVLPEFGARSRTQGLTFVVAVGKSF
jgi:hypothetical protein